MPDWMQRAQKIGDRLLEHQLTLAQLDENIRLAEMRLKSEREQRQSAFEGLEAEHSELRRDLAALQKRIIPLSAAVSAISSAGTVLALHHFFKLF